MAYGIRDATKGGRKMIVQPIGFDTALEIAKWRNMSRESLRTGWTTELQQEAFYDLNFKADYKYWEFINNVTTKKEGKDVTGMTPLAAGGFVNIAQKDAEIALIVHPYARKQGFGSQCIEWILHEGFANLGYETIWGEVYDCGAVSFWSKFIVKYNATHVRKEHQKYWDFKWYDSTIFSISRGEYVKRMQDRVVRDTADSGGDNRGDEPIGTDTRIGALPDSGEQRRDGDLHGVEQYSTNT